MMFKEFIARIRRGFVDPTPAAPLRRLTDLQKDAPALLFALHDAWPYVHESCTIASRTARIQALIVKHGDFADLNPHIDPSEVLVKALETIIQLNRTQCLEKYGDADKAETMTCVVVARTAISKSGVEPSARSLLPSPAVGAH